MESTAVIEFDQSSGFQVLDEELALEVAGGFLLSVKKGGNTRVNTQCLADNTNTQCIAINTPCASNVICPEVDIGNIL